MGRVAAVVLFLAVVTLVISVWMRDRPLPEGAPPSAVLARFRREHQPSQELDLAARYERRAELLDPKLVLPAWHRHPRAEAAAVAKAIKTCPTGDVDVHDAALRKAYDFAKAQCAHAALDAFDGMHPSGKSYAALAGGTNREAMHVLERSELGLAPRDWVAIARGDSLVVSAKSLVIVESGEKEKKLVFYDRDDWEDESASAAVTLTMRAPGAYCAAPASPSLCWTRVDPRRRALRSVTIASASVAGLAGLLLAIAFVRERRRASADRLHVFRTLTHELRTPAQSLGLDIDLLQSSYDRLPADAQESVLRVSDGIARLNRVIHRSSRYLQLFDGKGSIVKTSHVASARELMEELAAEWPEGVTLAGASGDGAVVTDPEWLSVALRNLVENGLRHGKAPVEVTWSVEARAFVVVVRDAGTSPRDLLRKAIVAYHRDERSKGLGLGLAIVQRIATLLKGTLTHSPSPTTWTLRLPRGDA